MRRTTIGRVAEFVPPDSDVPLGLETSEFVLEPLGPEHNELDYDAWTSSMEHIRATPGCKDSKWPREMTRDENRADLQRHADDAIGRPVRPLHRRVLRFPARRVPAATPAPRPPRPPRS